MTTDTQTPEASHYLDSVSEEEARVLKLIFATSGASNLTSRGYELVHKIIKSHFETKAYNKGRDDERKRIQNMIKDKYNFMFPEDVRMKITREAPSDHKFFGQIQTFEWILQALSQSKEE